MPGPWRPWYIKSGVIERPQQTIEKYGANLEQATVTDEEEDRVAEGKFFRSKPIQTGLEMAVTDMVKATDIRLHVDDWEPLHIVRYRKGGHYAWHVDNDYSLEPNGKQRKYTVVVPLNDTATGGGLEILWNAKPYKPNLKPGDAIIFPSTLVHRATAVKAGTRWVLVAWMLGHPLR